MADKTSFTPDEWARVVASPLLVGMAITAADPSGVWGLLKEGMAGGWALVEAKQNAQASPLVKAVAEGFSDSATRTAVQQHIQSQFKGAKMPDVKAKAIGELRAVSALLDQKAPQDAGPFKAWLRGGCPESRRGWQ